MVFKRYYIDTEPRGLILDSTTEKQHKSAKNLDSRPLSEIAALLLENQIIAASSVNEALPQIESGARIMAHTLQLGGRLIYAAAGSSALMALADALELGGTFGIEPNSIQILMAGGVPNNAEMPGDTEDDIAPLEHDLQDIKPCDTLIAISASGNTPYTLAAAKIANHKGTRVIAITNNPDSAIEAISDCGICLKTPPEVVSGSTRMGAATAQKLALNTLSTLMAFELGHIHDGLMVNLKADNAKLRMRANKMVQNIAQVSQQKAQEALDLSGNNVKIAALLSSGVASKDTAEQLLQQTKGHLRQALEQLKSSNHK